MKLKDFLKQHQKGIINRWFDAFLESYPHETYRYFSRTDKQFSNPVGFTVFEELQILYKEIIGDFDKDKVSGSLDKIVKIRAVQDFSPADAVAFLFDLKNIVIEEATGEGALLNDIADFREFDTIVDKCACMSFDIYMKALEKLYDIRANEIRNRSFRIIDRLNRKYDMMDDEEKAV